MLDTGFVHTVLWL